MNLVLGKNVKICKKLFYDIKKFVIMIISKGM